MYVNIVDFEGYTHGYIVKYYDILITLKIKMFDSV